MLTKQKTQMNYFNMVFNIKYIQGLLLSRLAPGLEEYLDISDPAQAQFLLEAPWAEQEK